MDISIASDTYADKVAVQNSRMEKCSLWEKKAVSMMDKVAANDTKYAGKLYLLCYHMISGVSRTHDYRVLHLLLKMK
jgi:hypothetical protein